MFAVSSQTALRRALIMVLLVGAGLPCVSVWAKEEQPRPAIEFESETVDMGVFPPGEPCTLTHAFVFHNRGDAPLKVSSAGHPCRTAVSLDRPTVEPGGSGEIVLTTVLPADYTRSERFSRQVEVHSNDPERPVVTVDMKATFAWTLRCEPEAVVFEDGSTSPAQEQMVTISSRIDKPFRITGVRADASRLEVSRIEQPDKASPDLPDRKRASFSSQEIAAEDAASTPRFPPPVQFAVRLCRDASPGPFLASLRLETDREDIPVITVPVRGTVPEPLTAKPDRVVFGIVKKAARLERTLEIERTDPKLEIVGIRRDLGGVTTHVVDHPGGWTVRVALDPSRAKSGVLAGDIEIHTTSRDCPVMTIPVRGLIDLDTEISAP